MTATHLNASSLGAERWREERQAEEADDREVEQQAEQSGAHRVAEADGRGVCEQPGPPRGHVLLYGLHLEVSAHDAAHVEQLVAVTCRGRHNAQCQWRGSKPTPVSFDCVINGTQMWKNGPNGRRFGKHLKMQQVGYEQF